MSVDLTVGNGWLLNLMVVCTPKTQNSAKRLRPCAEVEEHVSFPELEKPQF